jgi:hypothetical protein
MLACNSTGIHVGVADSLGGVFSMVGGKLRMRAYYHYEMALLADTSDSMEL